MKFKLINLLNVDVFDHPVSKIELIETHISWVILTGDIVYKIKKPVDFGFLDFSTLKKRRMYCEQEVLLNRRLAADIYLGVVAISGTDDRYSISKNLEDKDIIEYAVKMKQFPQSAQLDNKLAAGDLTVDDMDAVAKMVADFHSTTAVAEGSINYGSQDMVYHPVKENFELIREHLNTNVYEDELDLLQKWSDKEFTKLASVFDQRKQDGFIRECHGDMHLRNLVWLNDKPLAFDCIEFNPSLRWIDVISEVAFLVMDLQDRQQNELAYHFLNSYLEKTGDYAGLSVLSFYLCYRAMVRAKVDALQIEQKDAEKKEREQLIIEFQSYLKLASCYTKPTEPKLIIMRGLSASGKSTVSQQVVDVLGAIRVRSDVERKRLFNIPFNDTALNSKNKSSIDTGIYSQQASQQTYEKLAELASHIINAGFSVIVDAAFLKVKQREPFQALANHLAVAYVILEVTAPVEVLRQRIVSRDKGVSDADLAVLEHQLTNWQKLDEAENNSVISINTEEVLDVGALIIAINKKKYIEKRGST